MWRAAGGTQLWFHAGWEVYMDCKCYMLLITLLQLVNWGLMPQILEGCRCPRIHLLSESGGSLCDTVIAEESSKNAFDWCRTNHHIYVHLLFVRLLRVRGLVSSNGCIQQKKISQLRSREFQTYRFLLLHDEWFCLWVIKACTLLLNCLLHRSHLVNFFTD